MELLNKTQASSFRHHCSLCGKELIKYSRVSVIATNPTQRNKYTRKPVVNSYQFILCPNHFEDFKEMMAKFIRDNAKSKNVKVESVKSEVKVHGDIDDIDSLLD